MDEETRKQSSARKGNQNARIHGFYSKVLDEEEQRNFKKATEFEGLDTEIALLRVKIQSLLARDPDNIKLITQAVGSLSRLLMIKFNISKKDKQGLKEAMHNVLKDIAVPLGVGILQVLKK